tara:strand:+ start:1224 stop:2018 length:795 start_codon:yes stop_codon:yes gene_type:complete
MKSHGGHPTSSTLGFGNKVQIYFQWNVGVTAASATITVEGDTATADTVCCSRWDDQSPNGNHATQAVDENKPVMTADNALDFQNQGGEAGPDDDGFADMMDIGSGGAGFRVEVNNDFLSFIVCKPHSTATSCYLSDSGGEVLEFKTQNIHRFKAGGSSTEMEHNANGGIQCPNNELMLICVHRVDLDTGTMNFYKNGFKMTGTAPTNPALFDIKNLGSKNDTSNFMDGLIYDCGLIEATVTDDQRIKIEDYLMAKHGIERDSNI